MRRQRERQALRGSSAGSATRPYTGFSEDLLRRTAPYVATCDNEEALITALFDAGFRPASR